MLWVLLSLLFFSLIILSCLKIRHLRGNIKFIYHWGFLFGVFVWEDLLVISIYCLIGSLSALIFQQNRIGLLFFVVFWIVRSAGEALYFFLQQFIQPKHDPHFIDEHFKFLRKVFGKLAYQQCLIIMQVFFQIILMVGIICLILLMVSWNTLR